MNQKKPLNNSRSTVLWVIQTEAGLQVGPITTEEVINRISGGQFTGQEKIRRYPQGKWFAISQEPAFYDKLLEALEGSFQKNKSGNKAAASGTDAGSRTIQPQPMTTPAVNKIKPEPTVITNPTPPTQNKPLPTQPETPAVIELKPMGEIKKKVVKKDFRLPGLILAVAGLLIAAVLFLDEDGQKSNKPRLLFPRTTTETTLSTQQQSELLKKAVASFTQDTYESYVDTENTLVSLIEGAPQSAEPRGLLCLVYKELWPFVQQDSKDLESVVMMTKSARGLDRVGIHGIYCEVAKLMILGKYRDARGRIDHTLNTPELSSAPILFLTKAEILASEMDIKSAALYADTAKKNWPQWVRAHYLHAVYLGSSMQDQQAVEGFQQVMKMNPKHRANLIDYGSLLYNRFQDTKNALNLLSAAMVMTSKISRQTESKGHFNLAKIFAQQNQSEQALQQATKAYELNPGNLQYKELLIQLGGSPQLSLALNKNNELVLLGDQYSRSGDFLSAQAEYKAAFEIDPKNSMAAVKAAKCLWQLNQAHEASAWLNKAIAADNKLAMAYYLQADFYSQRYNFQAAVEALNLASKHLPNNFEILRGYGLIELRRNNFKDAVGFLERSLRLYDSDVDTLILLAKAQGGLTDFSKAQAYIMKAIELDGTNNEAQVTYAQIKMQYEGVEAALYYIKELINRFSYTIEFRLALADIYRSSQRYQQATEVFKQILEADPKSKKAWMGLGESLKEQAQFDGAIKAFLEAAVQDPSDAEPLFKVGQVYLENGKYKDAIVQFQRALKVNPNYPLVYFSIGKAAFLASDYELSVQSALEEKKKNPSMVDPYILLGEVYFATREYQKCAIELQQGIKLRPQGTGIYVKLARCLRLSGSLDVAESMLNIAASQESGYADIYKEQGAIYEQKGDRSLAAQAYTRYLKLSPNAPDRQEMKDRIQMLGFQFEE